MTAVTDESRLDVFDGAVPKGGATALGADGRGASDLHPVVWSEFWSQGAPVQDWCIEPIVPSGRAVALYAPAKVGKSLLALDVAAAVATGRPVLGQPARDPVRVVYLDFEMAETDLKERLVDLGYGIGDDLSRLYYYQLPALAPLDTPDGGKMMAELIAKHVPALVVVDTMGRAVQGEENRADTYRDYFRFSGQPLKEAGVAVLRLDHEGKDRAAGQRGSSAKVDDVDVVWRLMEVSKTRFELTRTHSRVPWAPAKVAIDRLSEPLRHVISSDTWPAGTRELAELLDELGVPLDASYEVANDALKGATGKGRQKTAVLTALRCRREQVQ